jgi:hypothetical protein
MASGSPFPFVVFPPMRLTPYSPRFVTEGQGPLRIFDLADAKGQVGTQSLNCWLSTCASGQDHVPAHASCGRVLPRNLPKIHSQNLPSFLYASKRCSSRSDHRLCLLVLECSCLSLLEHLPSSLLRSGWLSLKPPSSSLLDGLLPCDTRATASTALPCWGWIQ